MDKCKSGEELKKIISIIRKGQYDKLSSSIPALTAVLKVLSKDRKEEELKQVALCTRGILQSFQARDFVFMADLIEYELAPLLSRVPSHE